MKKLKRHSNWSKKIKKKIFKFKANKTISVLIII